MYLCFSLLLLLFLHQELLKRERLCTQQSVSLVYMHEVIATMVRNERRQSRNGWGAHPPS